MRLSGTTAHMSVRTMSVVAAILTVLIWAGAGFMQIESRRAASARAGQTTLNIALGIAHDIERTFNGYDLSLQATLRGLQMPGVRQMAPDLRDALLFDGSLEADDFGRISVIDAAGHLVYTSGGRPMSGAFDLSDRDYFRAHLADAGLGLFIGAPIESRATAEPALSLSRRLSNDDGSFAGVVVGSVRLRYFDKLFARLDLGAEGVMCLESLSGRFIARLPAPGGGAAQAVIDADTPRRLGQAVTVSFTARSAVDHVERFFTFHRVGTLPMVFGVGIASAVVYADWLRQTAVILLILVVMTSIGWGLVLLLRAELRRRHASEQAARQAAAQIAMLTDHANDIMMHVGPDGIRRFVSSGCERLFGLTAAQITNAPWISLVHPEDQPMLAAAFAAARAGGEVGLLCYRVRGGDGHWRDVETNCRALPNDEGVIFVIRDVTERTLLEQRLRQAQRREAIGQLTAGVAHDFNNMLQAQLSTLERLSDEVGDLAPASQLVRQAIGMADRGARMTHQLLSFSRQQVLRPSPVSLPSLLPELGRLLQQMLGGRIQVASAVDPDTPLVLADASYLEAALLNLALNARDAMAGGGRLTLTARRHDGGGTCLPAELDSGRTYAVVVVTDNGAGMDAATLQRACEPFFTTKGANGTGLGLASVQGFARQSGGELRISSEVGVGTRIEIWLPASEALAIQPLPPSLARQAGSARVLLVDDEPGVLDAIASCLIQAGFELEQAQDVESAIAAMASGARFDALVTDFILPDGDGAELVQQARRSHPGIATVVITGWAETERLMQLPAETEMVHKPFRRDELISRLMRAIDASVTAPADNLAVQLAGPPRPRS